MKIKKFMAFTAGVVMSLCLSTAVFAADGDNFVVGNPIDLATGQEVENLTAGQKVVIPVDFTTDTGSVTDFTVKMYYDTSILDYSIPYSSLTTTEADMLLGLGLDTYLLTDTDYANVCAVDPIGTWRGTRFTAAGMLVTNEPREGYAINTWATAVAQTVENRPETYFCFTVVSDVPDTTLNKDLFKLDIAQCSVNSDITIEGTANKANACYGAFNINIDSSVLPYWIQGLYVSLNGGEKVAVTEYKTTDNVNYTFPVRVTTNSTSAATATVEVFADTTTDEAGTANFDQVSMGTFEIQLNSPTSYTDQAVSAQ